MSRFTAAVVVALFLAGCGQTPRPEPIVRTVEVHVPVPVPCKAVVTVHQTYTDDTADQQPTLFQKVKALLIGRDERKEDVARLKAGIIGCGGTIK